MLRASSVTWTSFFNFQLQFFSIFGHKNPGSGLNPVKMNTDPKPWRTHLLFILECSVFLDPVGPQLLKAGQLRLARDTRVAAAKAGRLAVPPHVVLAHKTDAAAAATEKGGRVAIRIPREKDHIHFEPEGCGSVSL